MLCVRGLGFNCQCFQCSLFYYAIMIMNKSFHLNSVETTASLYQRVCVIMYVRHRVCVLGCVSYKHLSLHVWGWDPNAHGVEGIHILPHNHTWKPPVTAAGYSTAPLEQIRVKLLKSTLIVMVDKRGWGSVIHSLQLDFPHPGFEMETVRTLLKLQHGLLYSVIEHM